MKILKEGHFDFADSYGVIYQEGNIQKIITVNNLASYFEDITNEGTLEIRTCDFEVGIEKLFFYCGLFNAHEDEYEFRCRNSMTDVKQNLIYFAGEFKFAFETNPKLNEYLPVVFRELVSYLNIK